MKITDKELFDEGAKFAAQMDNDKKYALGFLAGGSYVRKKQNEAQKESEKDEGKGDERGIVIKLPIETILNDAIGRQAKYQVQYADYDLETWTVPVQLTKERAKELLIDGSVRKIRLEIEM